VFCTPVNFNLFLSLHHAIGFEIELKAFNITTGLLITILFGGLL
jgi:hypothetical protein